jgi:two-component system sensor histidine kinase CiaH
MLDALFASARLKLTLFYTIAIVVLSGSVSLAFYQRTASVIEREYERIDQRLQFEMRDLPIAIYQQGRRIQLEDLDLAKNLVAHQLLRINLLISILVGIGSYFLAGQTLKPIQGAMEAQKRFVGDAAHELKTPITALKTSLEVSLMDTTLSKPMQTLLQENLEDVTHLETLSNSLLRLATMEATDLQLEVVAVQPVIERVVRRFTPLARKKKLSLELQPLSSAASVRATEALLLELVSIFVDNALKYSSAKGSISLSVLQKRSSVEILIADTGPGIAKKDLPMIFDRFYRADLSRTTDEDSGGYGLGLALAQKMVQQLGGYIRVKSAVGSGTTFVLSLKRG